MEVYSLFQDLDLKFYHWEKGVYEAHKHNFFEFVYILKGQGIQTINNKPYAYKKGDFFLLIPNDVHHFEVSEATDFHVLLFNKIYFNRENIKQDKLIDFSMIFKHLEFILLNAGYIKQPIFTDSSERAVMALLMNHMQSEYENKNIFFETIIQNTVVHILCLTARKIREEVLGEFLNNGADSNITEVIFYIQDNIYDNEKIKVSNLASRFNKSRNLFGLYFKSNTGFTAKEYILNYKCNLVKNKLLYTNHSIGEIAYSLGFTDENHLNKFLKARLGMTASAFRKIN
ncbi:helix-turn-helix domain-containing protein [Flavobacterium gelatinilyticum]|uniref:helix-turn-helix domain-containing protein n=1 Tax=Flavobacterium gelatinilyticum TaxID=3003260 RepID=UPI0024802E10|nr:AraC family transcriptional regulator [Flavobacterium gelatinilyticum]